MPVDIEWNITERSFVNVLFHSKHFATMSSNVQDEQGSAGDCITPLHTMQSTQSMLTKKRIEHSQAFHQIPRINRTSKAAFTSRHLPPHPLPNLNLNNPIRPISNMCAHEDSRTSSMGTYTAAVLPTRNGRVCLLLCAWRCPIASEDRDCLCWLGHYSIISTVFRNHKGPSRSLGSFYHETCLVNCELPKWRKQLGICTYSCECAASCRIAATRICQR